MSLHKMIETLDKIKSDLEKIINEVDKLNYSPEQHWARSALYDVDSSLSNAKNAIYKIKD